MGIGQSLRASGVGGLVGFKKQKVLGIQLLMVSALLVPRKNASHKVEKALKVWGSHCSHLPE
jgi:hypothetical protein